MRSDMVKKGTSRAPHRALFKAIGLSIDWTREFATTDPEYYKWTQWQFLKFFEHGMAYKAKKNINWCPNCKMGLSNEDSSGGVHLQFLIAA